MNEKRQLSETQNSAKNGDYGAGGPEPIPLPPPSEILKLGFRNVKNLWKNWSKGAKGGKDNLDHSEILENPTKINPAPPSKFPATGRGQGSLPPAGLGVQHGKQRIDLTVSQGESQIEKVGNFENLKRSFEMEIVQERNEFTTENSVNFAENFGVQGTQNSEISGSQIFPERIEIREESEIGAKSPMEVQYVIRINPRTGKKEKVPFFYFEDEPPGSEFGKPLPGQVRFVSEDFDMRDENNSSQEIGADSKNFEQAQNLNLEQMGITEEDLEDERKFLGKYCVSGHSEQFAKNSPPPNHLSPRKEWVERKHKWENNSENSNCCPEFEDSEMIPPILRK